MRKSRGILPAHSIEGDIVEWVIIMDSNVMLMMSSMLILLLSSLIFNE